MIACDHRKMARSLALLILASVATNCTTIRPAYGPTPAKPPSSFSHVALDRVLERDVDSHGRVDYARLKQHEGDLDRYFRLLATFSPDSTPEFFPTETARLAYWINGYNAAAIKTVLHYYPIEGVLDVKRPTLLFFFPGKSSFAG